MLHMCGMQPATSIMLSHSDVITELVLLTKLCAQGARGKHCIVDNTQLFTVQLRQKSLQASFQFLGIN
eukprot:5270342-Amphidinium_carterae.1